MCLGDKKEVAEETSAKAAMKEWREEGLVSQKPREKNVAKSVRSSE